MPHIPFHPAPGFGDLLPGSFVVPQNPIQGASTPLVPSVQAAAGGATVYRPTIGDLLPGKFAVPQNPIRYTMQTGQLAGLSGLSGMGCASCGDGPGFYGMSGLGGLGDVSLGGDGFMSMLQAPNSFLPSMPNWAVYGGAALAAWLLFMPGGSEYRTKARSLRSQYRGYKRVGRTAGELAA